VRSVTGAGRLHFHTAPLDECRLPDLFVIPGDVLTVLHTYADFADVAYRNPRTGREASGWVRLDRLAGAAAGTGSAAPATSVSGASPAVPAADAGAADDAVPAVVTVPAPPMQDR
jgi:hypothetical protein